MIVFTLLKLKKYGMINKKICEAIALKNVKKIVIKLSGESLANGDVGINFDKALDIAADLKKIYESGLRLLLVIGGGNFWRGRTNQYMDSDTSDYVGMLGTEMNALVLGDALKQIGCPVKVFLRYSVPCANSYEADALKKAIDENIIIVGGGIGKPQHSTDSGAAAAAKDIEADLLIKMSKTEGIYDSDPFTNPNAKKIDCLTFNEAIEMQLGIMDLEAFEICKEANVSIIVSKMDNLLDIIDIANGNSTGSTIK